MAVFSGPEPDTQVVRSTGLTDRDAAMALAKRWEAQARAQRLARAAQQAKTQTPGRDAGFSQKEVALFLSLSERAVRKIEKRALAKLRRDPVLRRLWQEYFGLEEALPWPYTVDGSLDPWEIEALFGLTRNAQERQTLRRILTLIAGNQSTAYLA